jgi:putative membrane protein insertion efficiency factor
MSRLFIVMIRAYQVVLSPLLGARCRYYPTCSNYAIEALRVHGVLRGSVMASWRILRCNPFSHGGFDPVPPRHAHDESDGLSADV